MKDNVYILSTGEDRSVAIAHQLTAELKQAGLNYFYYQEGDYKDSGHASITDIYAKIEEANNIVIVLSETYINGRIAYHESLDKNMLAGVFCFLEIHHIMKRASEFTNRVHIIAADDTFLNLLQNNQIQPLYEERIKEYVQLSPGLTSTEQNRLIGAINDIDYFVRYVRDLRHHTQRPNEISAIVNKLKDKITARVPSTLTPYILNQQSLTTQLEGVYTAKDNPPMLIKTVLQTQILSLLQPTTCQAILITGKAGYGLSTLTKQIGLELYQRRLVYFININQHAWQQGHQNLADLIHHLNEPNNRTGYNNVVIVNGFFSDPQNKQQATALIQGVKDNKYSLVLASSLSEYSLYAGASFSAITQCFVPLRLQHYHQYSLPDAYTQHEQEQFIHKHQAVFPHSQHHALLAHLLNQHAPIDAVASLVVHDDDLNAFLARKIAKYQQDRSHSRLNDQLSLEQVLEMVCLFTQQHPHLLYQQSFMRDSQFIKLLSVGQFIKLEAQHFTGLSPVHDTIIFNLVKGDEYERYCNIINHFNRSTPLITLLATDNTAWVDKTALLRAIFSNMDTVLQKSNIHDMHTLFEAVNELGDINDQKPLLHKIYHHFAALTLDDLRHFTLYQSLDDKLRQKYQLHRWPFTCLVQFDKSYSYWQHGKRSKRLQASDKYSLYFDINAMVADICSQNPNKNAAIRSLLEDFPVRLSSLQHTSLHNTALHHATQGLDFYRLAAHYKVDITSITDNTKAQIEAYIHDHLAQLHHADNMVEIDQTPYIERRLLVAMLFLYSLYKIDNVLIGLDLKRIYAYLLNKHYFNAPDFERLTRLLYLKGLLKQEYFDLDTILKSDTQPHATIFALLLEYQLITPPSLHQFINYSHTHTFEDTPVVWFKLFSLYSQAPFREVFTKHQAWLSQQLTSALTTTLHTIQIQDDKKLMKVGGGSVVGTFWPDRGAIIQFATDTDNTLILHQCLIIFAYRDLAWAHLYDPYLDDKYLNLFKSAQSLNLNVLNLYTNLYNVHRPCVDCSTLETYLAYKHHNIDTKDQHAYSLAQEALFDVCHAEALTHYERFQQVSQHILSTLCAFYHLNKEDSHFIFPHNLMLELISHTKQELNQEKEHNPQDS